jgi:hypothetical protein
MTSVRPAPKYDDDKTYPKFLGGRLIEVSGEVLNCKDLGRTKNITMDEWYSILERFEAMEATITKMTKRIHTLEQHTLG